MPCRPFTVVRKSGLSLIKSLNSLVQQRHLEISREIGDDNGVEIATQSLEDLNRRRRERSDTSSSTLDSASVCQEEVTRKGSAGKEDQSHLDAPDVPPKTIPKRYAYRVFEVRIYGIRCSEVRNTFV